MDYMRQFLGAWRDQASGIRVFFADKEELGVAQKGQNKDSTTGGEMQRCLLILDSNSLESCSGWLL